MRFSGCCEFVLGVDNKSMRYLFILSLFLISYPLYSSIIGISTHPLKEHSHAFSAEMLGHMGGSYQEREVGMGIRYTRDLDYFKRWDMAILGGEKSQQYRLGTGLEWELLSEDLERPRLGLKGFYQYLKDRDANFSLIGLAPNLSKGFVISAIEVFPYLALPVGMRLDNNSDEFDYYFALTSGLSMPLPGDWGGDVLLNLELNRDLGASSDYIGLLISWMWN